MYKAKTMFYESFGNITYEVVGMKMLGNEG
jgi:hypothetical protein